MERILEGFCHHLAVEGFRLGRGHGVKAAFQGIAKAGVSGYRRRLVAKPGVADHQPLVKLFGKVVDVEGGPVACARLIPPALFLKLAPEGDDEAEEPVFIRALRESTQCSSSPGRKSPR